MSTFKDVAIENSITAGTVENPMMPSEDNELVTKKYTDNLSSHYVINSVVDDDSIILTYNDGMKEMWFKHVINDFKPTQSYGALFYESAEIPVPDGFNVITHFDIRETCSAGLHSIHITSVDTDHIGMYISNAINSVAMTLTFYIHLIGN